MIRLALNVAAFLPDRKIIIVVADSRIKYLKHVSHQFHLRRKPTLCISSNTFCVFELSQKSRCLLLDFS
jgi:hypothetical protein